MYVAALLAALSGAAALMFEHLWFRAASLALGSGVWSSAIVLAAFMAGLALGSLTAAALDAHVQRPLRVYGWIELAIGLTGLAVLLTLPRLAAGLATVFSATDSSAITNVWRFAVSFILMIIPAACMGATLPVLVRSAAGAAHAFGGTLGWLYGAQTAGAVVGVLVCELLLVPVIGLAATGAVAAGLNAMCALLAWSVRPVLARRSARAIQQKRPRKQAPPAVPTVARARAARLLAIGCACGALFLAFEVATLRFVLLFFTALSANFAIMLAVVLCGLTIGGLAGAWSLRRRPDIASWLSLVAVAASAALVLSYRLFPSALGVALTFEPAAALVTAVLAFTLPLSILSGMLFTFIGHLLHEAGLGEARATGWLTVANTMGAMAGSLLTGVVLIEWAGLERLFLLLAAGYGAIAMFSAATAAHGGPAGRRSRLVVVASMCVGALLLFPIGLMRSTFLQFPVNQLILTGEQRVALKEGQLETIQLLRADSLGRPDYFRLVTNNHSMSASDPRHRRYMRLFSVLPSILHPAPERAALLGLGLGITAQALTDDPRFTAIDVVDLSPDIPAMLPLVFPAPGDNPLDDPRVGLHVEDGRFFLATTRQRYDVITAEPPPPHYAGIANLYSREFFRLVADRLRPGGLATYWLPVHDLKASEARAIVAAFLDAFPETTLWTGSGFDWILMGLKPPGGGVTEEAFRAWWTREPMATRLREIGIDRPEALGALFLADAPRLRRWVGDTPPLTDNFPRRISLAAARDEADIAAFLSLMTASDRPVDFAVSPLVGSLWPREVRTSTLHEFAREVVVDTILSLRALRVEDLQRWLGEGTTPIDPLLVKALFWRHGVDVDRADALLRAEPGLVGPGVAEVRAALALINGRPREAADWLGRLPGPKAPAFATIRAYCLLRSGDPVAARRVLARD